MDFYPREWRYGISKGAEGGKREEVEGMVGMVHNIGNTAVAVIGNLTVGCTKEQYTLCWVLDAHYHGYRMLQLMQVATIYLQHKRLKEKG